MSRHFDDLMLGTLELFCRAAELQSFSQAAGALNISPAAVSKTIHRLEQKLGCALFSRTTRHVRLTEAGAQYLSYCKTALTAMYDAEEALLDLKTIPAGKIHVCLPNDYAYLKVFPLMPKFRRRYPQIEINFHLRFRIPRQDNADCDIVLTSWLNYLPDWVATKVDFARFRIFASPDYLKKMPLVINNEIVHIPTTGDAAFYEDVMAAYYMAINGNGVAIMHDFIARKAVENGQLVSLLEPWTTVSHIYYIACPSDLLKSPRIRAFTDFLTEELKPAEKFPQDTVIIPVR
ncbi:MAG: LysR family transcriptional regulator [Morganella sp. (in: enterobacteria)]